MAGFLLRWAFAFILVGLTYNPTDLNFVVWARDAMNGQMSYVALASVLLVIGYIIYLRATLRSIGIIGIMLVAALVGTLVWVAYDAGFLTLADRDMRLWLAIAGLSFILGIGMSWSHVRRALSGQADVDDADN